jgi:hypothetical protein
MKSSPDPVMIVSSHSIDEFADIGKSALTPSTACGSFDSRDLALTGSKTFESQDSSVPSSSEKSKIGISFKLRSPGRRRARRGSFSSRTPLSQSLPPVIAPTTSFDVLDDEEQPNDDSQAPSIKVPILVADETKATAATDQRLPIFRAPLPLRKARSSPVMKFSKSLILTATRSPSPRSWNYRCFKRIKASKILL